MLILPDASRRGGSYSRLVSEPAAARIKEWIQAGGTLVGIGGALEWMSSEKVGLLASKRATLNGKKPEGESKQGDESEPDDEYADKAVLPDEELPPRNPGSILRVDLDSEHWMAFGYEDGTNVLGTTRNTYSPVPINKGVNVGRFAKRDRLVLSGFIWEELEELLAEKAFLMVQPHGRGEVIAFTEDPNYRAFADGLNLLLMNAVLFGPSR